MTPVVALLSTARSLGVRVERNGPSMYGGSAIDSLLTASTIDERMLGFSKQTGELPVRAVCFLNGNNITPAKDAYRRWLVCNLTTELEHPERRDDIGDKSLRSLILENRAAIVLDALVILKAHALAGRPTAGWPPLGSYDEWDRVIRAAVWFATDRDCLATQQQTADEAPERLAKIALLEGWRELPGGKAGEGGVTSSEAVALVDANPDKFQTLRGVMAQRGRGGKLATSGTIGTILRGLKNNPVTGLKLRETGAKRHGVVCWIVEATGPERKFRPGSEETDQRGDSWDGGDSFNPPARGLNLDSDAIKCGDTCKAPRDWRDRPPPSPLSPPPIQGVEL